MLWAIMSSVFVVYLYRTLNSVDGAEPADAATSADAIDAELAKLNARIDAIENLTSDDRRGTMP